MPGLDCADCFAAPGASSAEPRGAVAIHVADDRRNFSGLQMAHLVGRTKANSTCPRWPRSSLFHSLAGNGCGKICMPDRSSKLYVFIPFASFALLAIARRTHGLDLRPIMDAPLNSTSLGEFWGRRWNGPFNQLAFENVFRPVARSTGPIRGTLVAFLASGLIHELVISLPARTGYGLPTAYFLLQGCGVIIQHRVPRIRNGTAGQFFTAFIVAVPAFWLFHPPFVRNVILPFMKAIGAL